MIGPKLANCWSVVVPRWPTVGNFRLDAKLAEEKGPALRSSESCPDTLQIKGIATPTISQTVANPSIPSTTIFRRFTQTANDQQTNSAT